MAAAGCCGPGLSSAAAGFAPDDAAELMRRVAATYARSAGGVVGVRSHSVLTIRAPLFRRRIARDGWFVFVDGELARSSERRDERQPPLRDPYRAQYARGFRFCLVPCPDCARGTVAVAFSSPSRDAEHARGRLVIVSATATIVSLIETPYKLPWPTQDGELVATWGAAAGGWFPLAISGNFTGRIGPFLGRATYAQALSSYGRFANVDAAASALGTADRDATGAAPAG